MFLNQMNLHWITEGSKNKPTRFTKSWVDPWRNEVPPPANPGHNFAGFTKKRVDPGSYDYPGGMDMG